jgi:hypothetical protein
MDKNGSHFWNQRKKAIQFLRNHLKKIFKMQSGVIVIILSGTPICLNLIHILYSHLSQSHPYSFPSNEIKGFGKVNKG